MLAQHRFALGAIVAVGLLCLMSPAKAVTIGEVYVVGQAYYIPQFWSYPDPDVTLTRSLEIWTHPSSSLVMSGELLDSGGASGLGTLSNEFRNFRAQLTTYNPAFTAINLIPPGHTWSPMEPNGWYTAYSGALLQLNVADFASDSYEFAFEVVSDYYFRQYDPSTGEFGEWEFQGVAHHGTVLITLHVIPDAATICLFGIGLVVLLPLGLKQRRG